MPSVHVRLEHSALLFHKVRGANMRLNYELGAKSTNI
jgi:hypothetical protein